MAKIYYCNCKMYNETAIVIFFEKNIMSFIRKHMNKKTQNILNYFEHLNFLFVIELKY